MLLFRTLSNGGKECFVEGTDFARSESFGGCVCTDSYYGDDCGIPEAAWYGHYKVRDACFVGSLNCPALSFESSNSTFLPAQ